MDTVAKQAEKGGSQSLNYDSGQTSGASTDRLYETGNPAIVNPVTPDSGNSATNMPSSAALARGKYLSAPTSVGPDLYVHWQSMGPPVNGARLWRRSPDVAEQTPPVWCQASPYSESSTESSACIRLTQQRLLFMKWPRPLPRVVARHPVGASMVPAWRHHLLIARRT
jgi:hypothetical protein